MKSIDSRLSVLEAASKSVEPSPYPWPLERGYNRLPILILRGPNEQAELESARAAGYVAELDTDENNERFLG